MADDGSPAPDPGAPAARPAIWRKKASALLSEAIQYAQGSFDLTWRMEACRVYGICADELEESLRAGADDRAPARQLEKAEDNASRVDGVTGVGQGDLPRENPNEVVSAPARNHPFEPIDPSDLFVTDCRVCGQGAKDHVPEALFEDLAEALLEDLTDEDVEWLNAPLGPAPACNFMRWTRRQSQPCAERFPTDQTEWCGKCLLRAFPNGVGAQPVADAAEILSSERRTSSGPREGSSSSSENSTVRAAALDAAPSHQNGLTFAQFSAINRQRCESPDGFKHRLDSWSTSDWFLATLGELGEAANNAKKLNRYRDGIPGNKESEAALREKLRKELGDVYVYLDLLAQSLGIDMGTAAVEVFNAKSEEIGCPIRMPGAAGTVPPSAPASEKATKDVVSRVPDGDSSASSSPPRSPQRGDH